MEQCTRKDASEIQEIRDTQIDADVSLEPLSLQASCRFRVRSAFVRETTCSVSILGTETLRSMQRFIEKEREDGMTELDAKQDEDAIRALRLLFQDFEDQLERDAVNPEDHMSVSSTEVEEQKPDQDSFLGVHHARANQSTEDEEDDQQHSAHTRSEEEPRLYLCDDWIQPVEVMKWQRISC